MGPGEGRNPKARHLAVFTVSFQSLMVLVTPHASDGLSIVLSSRLGRPLADLPASRLIPKFTHFHMILEAPQNSGESSLSNAIRFNM